MSHMQNAYMNWIKIKSHNHKTLKQEVKNSGREMIVNVDDRQRSY